METNSANFSLVKTSEEKLSAFENAVTLAKSLIQEYDLRIEQIQSLWQNAKLKALNAKSQIMEEHRGLLPNDHAALRCNCQKSFGCGDDSFIGTIQKCSKSEFEDLVGRSLPLTILKTEYIWAPFNTNIVGLCLTVENHKLNAIIKR